MEAQSEDSRLLGRQLEEAREELRTVRQAAEEAVAEAEDARKECGRVLRELAAVHEVGACILAPLLMVWLGATDLFCGPLALIPP